MTRARVMVVFNASSVARQHGFPSRWRWKNGEDMAESISGNCVFWLVPSTCTLNTISFKTSLPSVSCQTYCISHISFVCTLQRILIAHICRSAVVTCVLVVVVSQPINQANTPHNNYVYVINKRERIPIVML